MNGKIKEIVKDIKTDIDYLRSDRNYWFNLAVERGTVLIGLITLIEMNKDEGGMSQKIYAEIEAIKSNKKLNISWRKDG